MLRGTVRSALENLRTNGRFILEKEYTKSIGYLIDYIIRSEYFMEISFNANNYAQTYNKRTTASTVSTSRRSFDGLEILGPSAPSEVKEAWKKAEKESGVNGYGMDSQGKLTQLTELFTASMVNRINGKGSDVLGNSAYSARTAVQNALSRLGIPQNNEERKEKFFYEAFLRFL